MKVKSALKKMCEHCYFQRKGKKVYVRCKSDPRHKQRQGNKFSTMIGNPYVENGMFIQIPQFPEYHIDFKDFIKRLPFM
ncbi:unnamed protein product (macronuclear) [Paramecium tetraurelia]|uniref:Ribosomal protein n=2 Tax=Paramecium TaxID=5884 RepID=A0D3Y7_PARTE|nr:uncharacterized protein GSPATT00013219001 [Paramecium tetraurelia]CAD8158561.1 unnamed protein product [Paramecium octaurelia]CAK77754.1 unnamed protein product [Paramecium tetraurelia]|eukprot:XP_001445151.1 hypothetical protein (macronuclear) [Paramecium tetraurelia strain d4-2]